MRHALVIAALGVLAAPASAAEPLRPGYKVGEQLQILFWEYRVSGPGVEKPGPGSNLVCVYSTRPVAMVYTREITAPVVRLVKMLDEATAADKAERRAKHLGSYVVLICNDLTREKELSALAEKEKIRHTLLSLVVLGEEGRKRFDDRFGTEAETTVILATGQRQVKASSAYRKCELTDKEIDRILADVPKVLPTKP
jgi:hypothetical protein